MEDASTAVTPVVAVQRSTSGVRFKFLFWLVVVIAALMFFIHRFGNEALGMGWDIRFVSTMALGLIGLILGLFLGGFHWRSRLIFLIVVLGGGWLVKTQLIRGIEFDGALVPSRVDWIWNPPPQRPSFDSKPTSGDPSALLGSWTPSPTADFAEFRGPKR